MRIALAGGGTGGHLYPLIAVADAIIARSKGDVELSYFGPPHELIGQFEARNITIYSITSSKMRRYASIENIFDIPKFIFSLFQAFVALYQEMPDVIFSKGGPGALPVTIMARWYMIPVVIHESDAIPGLTNTIGGRSAKKILLAFKEAEAFFPPKKTRVVGNPVRALFTQRPGNQTFIKERLGFDAKIPLILVLGGSQGSVRINTFILNNLEALLPTMQIVHQTGNDNFAEAQSIAKNNISRIDKSLQSRYQQFAYLNVEQMKELFDAADVIISRAGSGAIFEIAAAGKPAILMPLADSAQDHQKANAYAYANTGAASVIEEGNLTAFLVLRTIKNMFDEPGALEKIHSATQLFFKPRAAEDIAIEVMDTA